MRLAAMARQPVAVSIREGQEAKQHQEYQAGAYKMDDHVQQVILPGSIPQKGSFNQSFQYYLSRGH